MIVFKYKVSPSTGLFGADDGEFSIEILSDGTAIYKTYILSDQEKRRKVFLINNVCMTEIKEILKLYQIRIKEMPKKLDNGSLDGSQNIFVFNGKKITVWNISYQDEREILEQIEKHWIMSIIRKSMLCIANVTGFVPMKKIIDFPKGGIRILKNLGLTPKELNTKRFPTSYIASWMSRSVYARSKH